MPGKIEIEGYLIIPEKGHVNFEMDMTYEEFRQVFKGAAAELERAFAQSLEKQSSSEQT